MTATLHPAPPGSTPFHAAFGLRITHYALQRSGPPHAEYAPRRFAFFSLSQLLDGQGWYKKQGKKIRYFPVGSLLIVTPDSIMDYGGHKTPYTEDYVCFAGPLAECLQKEGLLVDTIIPVGTERILKPIIECARHPGNIAQGEANILLLKLILDLYQRKKRRVSGTVAITELKQMIQAHPQRSWDLGQMAAHCQMSESQFRRNFKKETGCLPKQYLERIRMQLASEHLLSSSMRIKEIALICGYEDPYHFSKVFKKVFGLSPEHFKRKYIPDSRHD